MITDDLMNLMIGKISATLESAFPKVLITQENKVLDKKTRIRTFMTSNLIKPS